MIEGKNTSFEVTDKQKKTIVFLLILVVMSVNFSIDNFLPSVEVISERFNIDIGYIQLAFVIFTVSNIASCFIASVFLQKIKRRTLLLTGISIILFGIFNCAIAFSATQIIVGRFIYGLGYGAILIFSFTTISDLFKEKELAKTYALCTMLLALVPAISQTTGGVIQEHLGWRFNFIIPFILIFTTGYLGYKLIPETSVYYDKNIKVNLMVKNFLQPVKSIQFILCVLLAIFCVGSYYAYVTLGSSLYLVHIDLTPEEYGFLAVYMSATFIIASSLNKNLLKYKSYKFIITLGIIITLSGCSAFIYFACIGIYSTITILFPVLFILLGFYLIGANILPIAITRTDNTYGTAPGLFMFLRNIGVATLSMIILYIETESLIPLGIFFFTMFTLALILLIPILRYKAEE